MPIEGIIALIIVGVVVTTTVALAVFFSVKESRYERFVLQNSESIKRINELNNKYIFSEYRPNITFRHRFDNKGYWKQTEPVAYLSREIRDDLEKWFKLRECIEYNRTLLDEYGRDVEDARTTIDYDTCASAKKKHKKCIKIEKRLFSSKIQKPCTDVVIKVYLRYVSRQGKVDLTKSRSFGYVELVRILDSVSTRRVDRKTYERLAIAERAMLSDGMRYDVMRRDGFRCVLCGMSSKDGAVLHVDHIIPVSKGGKSVMSNLRTLCEKCNIGKSNKIE